MAVVVQEERCQVVICRHGQEISSGSKFVLKPGDIVRLGRGLGNEVVLDYLGVSRFHAEVSLKEPEEGSETPLPDLLYIRDLGSKNGIAIRKTPVEQESATTLGSFEALPAAASQALPDGCCFIIPANSRHGGKQMTVEQRMITFYVSTVMIDVATAPPDETVIKGLTKPKKEKTGAEQEERPGNLEVHVEGLTTLTGETWPPVIQLDDVEGRDIPAPEAPEPGPENLRRAHKVEVFSDDDRAPSAPTLTQANVAKASAAAAVAAGVEPREPPEVSFELRSVSPISTPGIFPWQAGKPKASKKKRPPSTVRGVSPSTVIQAHKKRREAKAKKKVTLTAAQSSRMSWDPYMLSLEASPSPCSVVPPGSEAPPRKEKKKRGAEKKKKGKDKGGKEKKGRTC